MHWLVSHTIPLSIGIESQSIDGSKMPFHASNLFLKDLSDKREISYNRTDSNSIGHKKTATEDQTLSKNLASNFPARWSVVVTAEASWPPPSTTWKSKKKNLGQDIWQHIEQSSIKQICLRNRTLEMLLRQLTLTYTYMIKKWRHCNCIDWPFRHIRLDKRQCSSVPQLKLKIMYIKPPKV